jgi:hypothetical protein
MKGAPRLDIIARSIAILVNEKRRGTGRMNDRRTMGEWEDILVRFGSWLDDTFVAAKAGGQHDL